MGPKKDTKSDQESSNSGDQLAPDPHELSKAKLNLQVLVEQRNEIFATVTQTLDNAKALTADDIDLLKAYYDELASQESKFEHLSEQILFVNLALPKDQQQPIPSVASAFKAMVLALKSIYFKFKRQQGVQAASDPGRESSPQRSTPMPNLAPLSIPIFDGSVEKWPEFRALFTSLIHENPSLSASQKFQYLVSVTKNEASSIISGLQISDENYPIAYDALVARYQNKRRLISMYLNQILNFKPIIASGSTSNLKHFLTVHQNSMNAIKALSIENLDDFLLLFLALRNMPNHLRNAFELKHDSNTIPTLDQLIEFVTHQVRTVELSESVSLKPNVVKPNKTQSLLVNSTTSNKTSKEISCPLCHQQHSLVQCNKYSVSTIDGRYQILRQLHRCFSCTGNHSRAQCPSKSSCRFCKSSKHHSSLHQQKPPVNTSLPKLKEAVVDVVGGTNSGAPSSVAPLAQSMSCTSATTSSSSQILLGTVCARIRGSNGSFYRVRGVIDPGSQVSAISRCCAQQLNLQPTPTPLKVTGIAHCDTNPLGRVLLTISPLCSKRKLTVDALVLQTIAGKLPSAPVETEVSTRFRHLRLADPHFTEPSAIDLLIGADLFPQIIAPGSKPIVGNPSALNTIFGWLIMGPVTERTSPITEIIDPPASLLSTKVISEQLKKFWEVENLTVSIPSDPLDKVAEDHFLQTHSRDPSGRFTVSLPFKPDSVSPQSNKSQALSSLFRLEKRLGKQPELYLQYREFLNEYLSLEHMSLAPMTSSYVIPHHVVTKEDSGSSKIRVVLNASQPDYTGRSLNQSLLSGPKLQRDIGDVLMSFRLHAVALCCDIQKMYRQIMLAPDDRRHQHIYWRPTPEGPALEYELNTVTYGLTPSAFQAQRVLRQLVHDDGMDYPSASQALLNSTYVDDIITGADDVDSAIQLRQQLITLLRKGGFELRKWSSSHPSVLADLPPSQMENQVVFSDPEKTLKILGINWLPIKDALHFRVVPFIGKPTKRSVLSYIAKAFDPLGLIAPIVVLQKIFLQQLWLCGLDWDDPLDPQLREQWANTVLGIDRLTSIHIKRCVLTDPPYQVDIVGFCDASQHAYAAVVYLCFQLHDYRLSSLWKAKTKVAPLKTLSIPRLELSSAVMLAELVHSICQLQFPFDIQAVRLFSDSELALGWIASSPHTLKTFVANRVARVQELPLPASSWSHVPSKLNPADLASRGLTPEQLISKSSCDMWYHGPPFINDLKLSWPDPYVAKPGSLLDTSEVKMQGVCALSVLPSSLYQDISRFPTYLRLQRVFAWILRFSSNTRNSSATHNRTTGPLAVTEIEEALTFIVRIVQMQHFSDEISQIHKGTVPKSLHSLTPFLDDRGVLRVGGRLSNSPLPYEAQHPILLPKRTHLASLICDHYHRSSLHAGPNATQAAIRQKFWILASRSLVRQRINLCRTCHLFRGRVAQPSMADLPACRVTPSRPFLTTGVDFAGPFPLKVSKVRSSRISKCYLCLYICTSTKAVHLEPVSELSTPAFLASLDRFVSRRGLPQRILSDQGRNFVGARNHLREVEQFLQQQNDCIFTNLSTRSIHWDLNPPYAPNFGGLWEAGVKSAKRLLARQIGDSPLLFEEYATLFARIEAALNSRPLYPLSSDPAEAAAVLTPGHFLIGAPLLSVCNIPPSSMSSYHDRWRHMSDMFQRFWEHWSKEYLNHIIQRQKWTSASSIPKIGDIVFVKGRTTHPLTWPIARIKYLHSGSDTIPRVATITTTLGEYVRPLRMLIPLPEG